MAIRAKLHQLVAVWGILTVWGISRGESKMYWTDDGAGTIKRANLDGSGIETIVSGLGLPRGIAMDLAEEKMYWCQTREGMLKRANLDGTDIELLISNLHTPQDIALDTDSYQMYCVDNGGGTDKIIRANMDGSDIEVILLGVDARSIALDLENGKIYWTRVQAGEVGNRSIRRANLDGTARETVLGGLGTPDDIALDLAAGKMYWTDQSTHKVQRANLDGTEVEDLVVTGLDRPYGIALDLADSRMYWVDWGTNRIQRACTDGSDVEYLVTSGLTKPLYIALVLEPAAIPISVDIKPHSCPNPLNVKSKGVFPVAIAGAENFDVSLIEVLSIRLHGITPIRSAYEDATTPRNAANGCDCSVDGPDGLLDLTLKFETAAVIDALGEVANGDELILQLTGTLRDGTPIVGEDCITIRKKGKGPKSLADLADNWLWPYDMTDLGTLANDWPTDAGGR